MHFAEAVQAVEKVDSLCGRRSKLPRHCHPLQFPLKSFGFPGAETARKRFLLWEMGFPDAKISTEPDVHAVGLDFLREGFGPLALS